MNLFICQQSISRVLASKTLHCAQNVIPIVESTLRYGSGYSFTSFVIKGVEKWVLNSDHMDSVPFKEIFQKLFLHKRHAHDTNHVPYYHGRSRAFLFTTVARLWARIARYSDWIWLESWGTEVRFPEGGKRFFSFPQSSDWLWCPPSLLSTGYCGLSPGSKVAEVWSWPLTSM
jgi:hypothetical protein